jgi:diguanylate cyclase (GGDEF)-like protein
VEPLLMSPMGDAGGAGPRVLSADQSRRLLRVHSRAGRLPAQDAAIRFIHAVGAIVGTKAALLGAHGREWAVVAETGPHPALPSLGDENWRAAVGARERPDFGIECWRSNAGDAWTLVGLRPPADAPSLLVLEGDWSSSAATLSEFARSFQWVEDVGALASRARAQRASYRLARRLAALKGLPRVSDAAVQAIAHALESRIASLAVPDAERRELTIVATHGYPLALVEHLRIPAGAGVLGAVYQSRRSIAVEDVSTFQGASPRRPRYRTGSFMALPLRTASGVLGVVCVSDRLDGRPFTRADLSTLRTMAAPAALALGRERAEAQAESFAHAATIDPVSGLFNRRFFQVRLEEELQRARRHNMHVALLLLDLDDFKVINDTFGHMVGDVVIKDPADILRRSVRAFDVCTRFGGEEFAIVMPDSSEESAVNVAERIRQRIEDYRLADVRPLRLTASVGIAVSGADHTVGDLVAGADQALYLAKRAGKNQTRGVPKR